jgi:hypothetical protein
MNVHLHVHFDALCISTLHVHVHVSLLLVHAACTHSMSKLYVLDSFPCLLTDVHAACHAASALFRYHKDGSKKLNACCSCISRTV